jgi:hypothetical protein
LNIRELANNKRRASMDKRTRSLVILVCTEDRKVETTLTVEEQAEQERKKRAEEVREQEAREFLHREAERVLKEREEKWQARKREPSIESKAPARTHVLIIRPPSEQAKNEVCKCGYPGCLGHEVIDNHATFPGFTSETVLARSPHEIVRFLVEMIGVAGNPSDGELPGSALQTIRKPRG